MGTPMRGRIVNPRVPPGFIDKSVTSALTQTTAVSVKPRICRKSPHDGFAKAEGLGGRHFLGARRRNSLKCPGIPRQIGGCAIDVSCEGPLTPDPSPSRGEGRKR